MSIIPIVYDPARNMGSTLANRPFLEDFGFGISPHEIFHTPLLPTTLFDPSTLELHYPFNRFNQMSTLRNDNEILTVGKDGFEVSVDVKQFKPNELTVKTTDNYVVVEGKHEEREDDHGFIQRHFVRKYWLPRGYNPDEVVSAISSDGVLTIKAPTPKKQYEGNERVVKIQQTGTAHNAIKNE